MGEKKIENKIIIKQPGHFYILAPDKNGETRVNDINLLERIDIIVEFKEQPLFIKNRNSLFKSNEQEYRQVFEQFERDIGDFTKILSKKMNSQISAPLIKKTFFKLFNGVNIDIPKVLLSSIYSLDYVKSIHKNETFKIIDDIVQVKNNSQIINSTPNDGANIIIGIIDTGIDYLHPALGGGFGPGYKVIGGYDIADDDADPMDEIGHGTHVAGIAAANGNRMRGVAPEALLMAFKVFSREKPTFESTIIEAVERALDPNNDGNYEDRVDIVNMSLGGAGSPDDPISTAVNNGTKLGTVFCISAGNSGGYNMIMSPGNALSAICVGAKDTNVQVASFSSKGPTKKTYSIKPDVIAPGVNIKSTYPDNSYEFASGTSMSAPYVAGLCALIKSEHEDWTPEQIKSAVMSSAVLINDNVMAQGSGTVDLEKALKTQTTIFPSSLSFGYCNVENDLWTKSDTFKIKNESSLIKSYILTNPDGDGFIEVIPNSFTLGPKDSIEVEVKLNVNNSSTPYIQEGPFSYGGIINISNEMETLHIPWAFVKAPKLMLRFNKPVIDFLLTTQGRAYFSDYPGWDADFTAAEMILPSGTYDLSSIFFDFIGDSAKTISNIEVVMEEEINFSNYKEIAVNSESAKNRIYFGGLDENGEVLSNGINWNGNIFISYPESSMVFGTFFCLEPGTTLKLSDFSDRYSFLAGEFQEDLIYEKKVRVLNYQPLKGVSSDLQFSNSTNNYKKLNIDITLSPFKRLHNFAFGNTFRFSIENFELIGSFITTYDSLESIYWNGTLFLTPCYDDTKGYTTEIYTDIRRENSSEREWFFSKPFRIMGDSIGCFLMAKPSPDVYFAQNNGRMSFGNGIPAPNLNTSVYMERGVPYFDFNMSSYGQLGEFRPDDIQKANFALFNSSDKLIRAGSVEDHKKIPISLGEYKFSLSCNNYVISEKQGNLTLTNNFSINSGITDFYTPALTSIQVRNSYDSPVSILGKKEKGYIKFSVVDYSNSYLNVQAFIKEQNSESWNSLKTKNAILTDQYMGSFFTADISGFTDYDSTALDLKILLANSNNSSEIIWKPAVGVGKFKGDWSDSSAALIPAVYKLFNNYPNPFNNSTTIYFFLPEPSKIRLEVFNILGERIETILENVEIPGEHKVVWNADRFSSAIYFYRLTAEGKSYFQKTNKMVLMK